ncbi:MAG TPA: beta-ketoacyl synthase N-terminal-like domain-containing protein, partial [Mycobacteriales bacterium]|nr:beta-ketoacyl synthase N-terminal-like domain-containing protein [Mycobacteriales bacterium]
MIVQVAGDGSEQELRFSELLAESLRVAGGLRAARLQPGSPVIVLPGGAFDLPGFWGAIAAGLVPVPLAPAPDKVLAVWAHLDRPPIVVGAELARLAAQLPGAGSAESSGAGFAESPGAGFAESSGAGFAEGPRLLTLAELREAEPLRDLHQPKPDDIAFLQFSSGSTGAPKGVELSSANLLANLHQTRTAGAARASDVVASWLPYFHDMGLIGAHLTPLSVGMKQVKLEASDFGKRPALWYETAARHSATLLPMASFALALTLKRVSTEQVTALDLSAVRLVGVGAEPIPVATARRFVEHLRPAGLRPSALVPVYGLAEATLAVAFPPLGEVARPLRLERRALAAGLAVDVAADPAHVADPALPTDQDGEPAEFFDVGYAVVGGELRVVDDHGAVLPDSAVGQIEFRGPNVARGYHRQPAETLAAFADGWLRTGDVGFLRAGRLCVTGRSKDVVFVHGQKFHAHDLEQVVASSPDVPSGRVAVVGLTEPTSGVERVAVFVTSREPPTVALAPALAGVRARVREVLGYDGVCVLPIPPEDFPRTTSGKVQRSVLRERLAAGGYAELAAAVAALLAARAEVGVEPPAEPLAKPPPAAGATAPRTRADVEAQVTDIWAEVLGVPTATISPDDRFLAIGGSSLAAMHVLARLEETYGESLTPSLLRDCPTVATLAEQLTGQLTGHLARPAPAPVASAQPRRPADDPAAIIGMACRFPDADTPEAFWRNLADGRDSVTAVPASRWSSAPGAPPRWGAFLDDVADFDAHFFGVDAAEAAAMDPHARLFLEVAHEALERAGYAGERRRGRRIGVFVAVGESGYASLLERALEAGVALPPSALVGNLRNLIAARVAHCLNLTGPALAVDTACSSALVALHLARRSLAAGECDAAVVGGVSLNLTATGYRLLEGAQALSPTGRSRAFSADADGFVPGEGAAALVLEPCSVAEAAGDPVLAVVRGTTVNNDGRSMSLMAPNPLLQEAVIVEAYREAGVDPATVSYVEAHGTGTAIGDPIEAR